MEKSAKEVFNEIQTTINNLRAQLDELEDKLSKACDDGDCHGGFAFHDNPIAAEPEPESVEEIPEPVVVEIEESEEPVDLSIDMEALGAKTLPDAKNFQWMIDLPGSPVANVISAISLNDRVLFINTLFKEDPSLFQQTIGAFNGMETISEAVSYVIANFPDWNLNSEVVYRLMMAVRRKLK